MTVVATPITARPDRRRRPGRPVAAGGSANVDLLANDLDPDGHPAELTVRRADPALPVPSTGVVTLTDRQESSRHVYTITDPAGLSDGPR